MNISRLTAAMFVSCTLLLSQPLAAGAEPKLGVQSPAMPVFTEIIPSDSLETMGKDFRAFDVVFPGHKVTGVFKSIVVKSGKLDMEPADREQLFFQPSREPVTSRIYLTRNGVIAPELLRKRETARTLRPSLAPNRRAGSSTCLGLPG